MKVPLPNNEAISTEALHQHQILDIEPEAAFDDMNRLAAQICETPVALVSLVDECRQWFKTQVGMEAVEPKRDVAFCNQTILTDSALIVPDVLTDERFATNSLVLNYPQIRFFAAVPLIATDGHTLGKLCVIDYVPRELSQEQVGALWALSRQAVMQLELRRNLVYMTTEPERKTEQLRQQTERERLVVEIAQRIRQSLSLSSILSTTVFEVRQFLQVERVFIYRFEPDWGGIVVVESVASEWRPILGSQLKDPTFVESYVQPYKQGRIQATADIYSGELTQCYVDFLAEFQVKAALIVPILQGEELWGLLVANHCSSPRQWQELEIDLLSSLATQVGIAIQQSTLFEQVQTELAERKRAEQKILEQAALLDVASDAIFVCDLENQIVFWNQGAKRLYGWQATEAQERNANELLYKGKGTEFQFATALQAVFEQGEWQGELTKIQKSGKEVIVASRLTLVLDEQGQPKSILTVDTDITEKKQLETQFLRAQRLENLGILAGGIAHDLNNILTPILAIAQLLPLTLPNLNERNQQMLEILETNTKRGAELVKQILSFARGTEGKRTILQVKHLLLDIEQIAKGTFPKSIEIEKNILDHLWTVAADATQLHQVFMNLAVNARDAMPNGGTLSISAENLFIDEKYARMNIEAKVGSYVKITFADTGIGISPEIIDRIFDPFFTTKEVGKGTGLGLSTVVGIIKNHGGFVEVYTEVGKGSRFRVYLPASEETACQTPEDLKLSRGHAELILFVDDEPAIAEISQNTLSTYNYRVLIAKDGIEAIALYAQHKHEIRVVIMDMMMPSLDGATATRTLQKIDPSVQIIAMSGSNSSEEKDQARGGIFQGFLSKPFTANELLNTVHQVLTGE